MEFRYDRKRLSKNVSQRTPSKMLDSLTTARMEASISKDLAAIEELEKHFVKLPMRKKSSGNPFCCFTIPRAAKKRLERFESLDAAKAARLHFGINGKPKDTQSAGGAVPQPASSLHIAPVTGDRSFSSSRVVGTTSGAAATTETAADISAGIP